MRLLAGLVKPLLQRFAYPVRTGNYNRWWIIGGTSTTFRRRLTEGDNPRQRFTPKSAVFRRQGRSVLTCAIGRGKNKVSLSFIEGSGHTYTR